MRTLLLPVLSHAALAVLLWAGATARDGLAQERDETLADFWLDDDIEAGLLRARRTARPLLVAFRCPP